MNHANKQGRGEDKKRGRPTIDEERDSLTVVNFKADQETREAIDALLDASGDTARFRSRSAVIRRALIEAAARIASDTRKE